jgi:hypothetical protein
MICSTYVLIYVVPYHFKSPFLPPRQLKLLIQTLTKSYQISVLLESYCFSACLAILRWICNRIHLSRRVLRASSHSLLAMILNLCSSTVKSTQD